MNPMEPMELLDHHPAAASLIPPAPIPSTEPPATEPPTAHAEAHTAADLHARFFRALGDPTRVRLLRHLLAAPIGECSVSELVTALDAPQSRISTHLGCLRWCGLVQTRRDGKHVYYRIADPRVRELLSLASALVRDHATGIASCDITR